MDFSRFVNPKHREILKRARDAYGDTAQILVSVEELNELSCVCAKFPRYEDPDIARRELHSKAVDEVADVLIVLDHIINIFDLTPVDIGERVNAKVARMDRWLSKSQSQSQTMIDRDVNIDQQMSLFKGDGSNATE